MECFIPCIPSTSLEGEHLQLIVISRKEAQPNGNAAASLAEIAAFPIEGDSDAFSGRDHDTVLYPILPNMMNTNIKPADWRQHIVSTPDVLSGKPRIDGTRIPVALVLGYLADVSTHDEIIKEFPDLKREDTAACLDYARDLADYQMV